VYKYDKLQVSNATQNDAPPNSWIDSIASPKVKTTKGQVVGACSLVRNILGEDRRDDASGWGLWRMISMSIIHMNLHKLNNKLVDAQLEHFWCMDKPWINTDSQNSPRPKLGEKHYLLPYNILCAWPRGLHPNVICPRIPKLGVPKFSKLGLLQLWRPIISCAKLKIEVKFESKF
jgi:hypothetical protein